MKVLFIQLRQIGDILMCTPALRSFRKQYPEAVIHFLCSSRLKFVLEGNPVIDRIITCENQPSLSDALRLRKEKYDVVVDFISLPRTAFASFISGANTRIGLDKRGRTFFYTHPCAEKIDTYSALNKLTMLATLGVNEADDTTISIYPDNNDTAVAQEIINRLRLEETPNLCAFSPVSRRDYKRWPYQKYAHICDSLHELHNIHFLPLFGPGEESAINAIVQQSRHPEAFKFPYSPPPFKSLCMLLKQCFFFFGNDNGIRHLAIAENMPTATIFGIPAPVMWTPPKNQMHKWIWGRDNIAYISENQVADMLNSLLIQIKTEQPGE